MHRRHLPPALTALLLLPAALGACSADGGTDAGPDPSSTATPTVTSTGACELPEPTITETRSGRQLGYLGRTEVSAGASRQGASASFVSDVQVSEGVGADVLAAAGQVDVPDEVSTTETVSGDGPGNGLWAVYAPITVSRGTWSTVDCDGAESGSGEFTAITGIGPAQTIECGGAVVPDRIGRRALAGIGCRLP